MKRCIWCLLIAILILAVAGVMFLNQSRVYQQRFNQYRKENSFNELREKLMLIASNAALSIDAEDVLQVPLRPNNDNDPAYQKVFDKLVKIKQVNPAVKYVYIMAMTDQPGIMQYVADADPVPSVITAKSPTALSGDKYDARGLPEMIKAYNRPSADNKVTNDEWGTFLSGYAPICDAEGKTVAILGIDIDASLIDRDYQVKSKGNGPSS